MMTLTHLNDIKRFLFGCEPCPGPLPSHPSLPSKDISLSLPSTYLPWSLRHNLQPHFLKSINRNKPMLFWNPN
ncbi:hypothetical protein RchiOBHm_Chr4g0406071 [Rosa chinensis]|uniref:Uncharacterized protein n=1 Tax=Rosa chinensis TaxID=74649 RepID=A0A2P6QU87_ROSCH|nr:hypothetical protein RchiOBHm_Chr4g0406071 [Rosa chinensis]